MKERILVVNDEGKVINEVCTEGEVVNAACTVLLAAGYQCNTATTRVEVLAFLADEKFDMPSNPTILAKLERMSREEEQKCKDLLIRHADGANGLPTDDPRRGPQT